MSQLTKSRIMTLPKVAIIGRPNVGKSSLFNILVGGRKAVVKDQAGVTRDILVDSVEIWGKWFDILDTGGLTESPDLVSHLIRKQVIDILETVDFLIVVMDGRVGLTPEDREVYKIAKAAGKPMLIVVNKIDRVHEMDMKLAEFYEFGEDLIGTSFETRSGVSELLEKIHNFLPEQTEHVQDGLRIAFVGKPNVGKSSLVNILLGERRMIVSPMAGTTVDSVEAPFVHDGKKYILVDTAGLRKTARQEEDIEIIASFKTREAIRLADLLLLVIDGTEGPTDQDAKILEKILEAHKMVIVVANKSDLAQQQIDKFRDLFKDRTEDVFHFYQDLPIVFTSAVTGKGLNDLLTRLDWAQEKMNMRIPTSELNDFFFSAIRQAPAPVFGNNNVKFYYVTQTRQKPPAFIAFANQPEGVDNAYRRFLINRIKDEFDLKGVPIRIFVMKSRGC
jgi:GTP-binding protein